MVSVTLTVSHGTLSVSSSPLVSNNGTNDVTISGSAAAVDTLLTSLSYTPTANFTGTDTLNVSVISKDGIDTYPTPATAVTTITVFSPTESPPDLQATLGGLTGGNAIEDTPVTVASITDGDTPPVSVSPSNSSVSYQWQISSNGTTWTNILGATSSSYDPTAADFGMHLRVEIFYSENDGGGTTIDTVTKSAGIVGEATEIVASGGNWKQSQSWVGGSVPTSTQNAVVETNVGLQINGSDSETVGSLSLEGVNKGVSVASNSTLTVNGPITVLGGNLSVTGSSTLIFGNVGGGISGNFIVSGSGSSVSIGGGNTLRSTGPSGPIELILTTRDAAWTGELYIQGPDGAMHGGPLEDITVQDDLLRFRIQAADADMRFTGQLRQGKLTGVLEATSNGSHVAWRARGRKVGEGTWQMARAALPNTP